MTAKNLLAVLVLITGLSLANSGYANDINSSWSVGTLRGQAMTEMIKRAKMQKYTADTRQKTRENKPSENKNQPPYNKTKRRPDLKSGPH